MTPLEQFDDAKKASNGALLLFKIGYFYEAFREDAKIVSSVLGLSVTIGVKKGAESTPMAGFPAHHLDAYLMKLVKSGHRVGVCEQVDDACEIVQVVECHD